MVGRRIQERRKSLPMTQDELGRRLGPLLGKTWSRQAVSLAESGQRAFTAAELVALATVLETPPTRLITPPAGLQEIEMPSGGTVPTRGLVDLDHRDPFLAEVWELTKRFVTAQEQAQESNRAVSAVVSALATRVEEQVFGAVDHIVDDMNEQVAQNADKEGKEGQ